jgi:intracellular sulfur oxidation DsrE/DsrF family protein
MSIEQYVNGRVKHGLQAAALVALVVLGSVLAFARAATVDGLLAQEKAPPGVVFEIVEGDADALSWAIPQVKAQSRRLRERFPGLSIAVVTHGREMFALQADKRKQNEAVHQSVESLSKEGVPVHVCETYAARRGVAAEAFPEYVNVAPAGPAQVNSYRDLGYEVIRVRKGSSSD